MLIVGEGAAAAGTAVGGMAVAGTVVAVGRTVTVFASVEAGAAPPPPVTGKAGAQAARRINTAKKAAVRIIGIFIIFLSFLSSLPVNIVDPKIGMGSG